MLGHYIAEPAERTRICSDLFEAVKTGRIVVRIGATYPLEDAARAHAALESRQTIGSTVLAIADRAAA